MIQGNYFLTPQLHHNVIDIICNNNMNKEDLRQRLETAAQIAHEKMCQKLNSNRELFDFHYVLNHGFVRLVDFMGDDSAITQAARVSYGDGTKQLRQDIGLINYLLKHGHTSPFEMCEIKLHVKMPIFVARQWIRHRTANVNEYSARYSVLSGDYYIPQKNKISYQSKSNMQGRQEDIVEESDEFLRDLTGISQNCLDIYKKYIDKDIARELCRTMLPVNFFTEMYWKIDLHNLLHFLKLRSDSHAQYEIRVYAEAILEKIVKKWVPITYDAFKKHVVGKN